MPVDPDKEESNAETTHGTTIRLLHFKPRLLVLVIDAHTYLAALLGPFARASKGTNAHQLTCALQGPSLHPCMPTCCLLHCCRATAMSVPMVLLTIPAKVVAGHIVGCIYDWQIEESGYNYVEAVDKMNASKRAFTRQCQVKWKGLYSSKSPLENKQASLPCKNL